MLGEGFDLPNLKIAAIHDGRKSLAASLQFIGRFTRLAEGVDDASAVINIADGPTNDNLSTLYSEGADWDQLIRKMSDGRVQEELELQEIVDRLREGGNLHQQISLMNLTPSFSTQIYTTECQNWNPLAYSDAMHKDFKHWFSHSVRDNLLVVLGVQEDKVKWGRHGDIRDVVHKLLLLHWIEEDSALFVYSSDVVGLNIEKIVSLVTDDNSTLLHGERVFQVLKNIELPLAKSLGSTTTGMISFSSYFGANVTEGLDRISKSRAELNNIACIGYENGERVLWGAAKKKGKIWQTANGTVLEWMNWCKKTWEKINVDPVEEIELIEGFLTPVELDGLYDSYPIYVSWGEYVLAKSPDKVTIYFGENKYHCFEVDIDVGYTEDNEKLSIEFTTEGESSTYSLTIGAGTEKGHCQYELLDGSSISVQYGRGEIRPLEDHLNKDPLIIGYQDGSYSYNWYHIPVDLDAVPFDPNRVEAWNWNGIPLNQESMGKDNRRDTIQYKTFEQMEPEHDLIFNDDGKGEAADLVCLTELDGETIKLTLVHCKNAYDGRPTGRIDNFYTVCGQAQKSSKIKHRGIDKLVVSLLRRQNIWTREGKTRFLKGDVKLLEFLANKAKRSKLLFEVVIVQPGGIKSSLSDDILILLGTTEHYLQKTTQAEFRVITSS